MIHNTKIKENLLISYKKKLAKVLFVVTNLKLQKYTCIRMMITLYDTHKNVSFEVQQSMKTPNEAMSEQTISV